MAMQKLDQDSAEDESKKSMVQRDDGTETPAYRKLRMIQTVVILLSWISMGLFSEISGPTLTFLKARVCANYEEISRTLVARSAGFMIGSLTAAPLFDRFYKLSNTWLGLALVIGAVATAFQPWSTTLELLGVLCFLDGLAKGWIAVGGNSLLFSLWKDRSAIPTHLLHGSFGIGALIAPQIARPFLPLDSTDSCPVAPLCNSTTATAETNVSYGILGSTNLAASVGLSNFTVMLPTVPPGSSSDCEEHIEYPYGIIAIIVIINGAIFFALQCYGHHYFGYLSKESNKPQRGMDFFAISLKRKLLAVLFLSLFCVLWALPMGAERAYGKFLFSFATDTELNFTARTASDLVMVFWVSFTGGRALSAALSICLEPLKLLVLDLSISTAAAAILVGMGHYDYLVLWICTGVFAATLSPISPASFTWTNTMVTMTPALTSLAFIASSLGAMVFSWLSGMLFEQSGPRSLMIIILCYCVLATVMIIVIQIFNCTCPLVNFDKSGKPDQKTEHEEEMKTLNQSTTTGETC